MGDLTKNFSEWEFRCKCCNSGHVKKELVRKLQKVRDRIGIPITVNSGFRCLFHNREVGSADTSAHLDGFAVDIKAHDMFVLLRACIKEFDRIGIGGEYLHVDIDPRKTQFTYWIYSRKDE